MARKGEKQPKTACPWCAKEVSAPQVRQHQTYCKKRPGAAPSKFVDAKGTPLKSAAASPDGVVWPVPPSPKATPGSAPPGGAAGGKPLALAVVVPVRGFSKLFVVALNMFLSEKNKMKPSEEWVTQQDDYLQQAIGPRLMNPVFAFFVGMVMLALPAFIAEYGPKLKEKLEKAWKERAKKPEPKKPGSTEEPPSAGEMWDKKQGVKG